MQTINQNELIIKKSKFISYAVQLDNKSDIENALKQISKLHNKATHICYAYIFNKDVVLEKYSDAGEPKGAAGKPILSVLKKKNLKNIIVIVVRYFGGTKLGMGGLIRAYSKAASAALG